MSLSDRGVQSMSNQRHATTNKVSRLDKKGASYDFTTNGAVLRTNSTTPRYYITTQLHPCAGGAYGSSPFVTGPQTEGICEKEDTSKQTRYGDGRRQGLNTGQK